MNSVEGRCSEIQKKNPGLSSYACFAMAIMGRNYSERTISHWFKLLVEKDDYSSKERKAILKFLRTL